MAAKDLRFMMGRPWLMTVVLPLLMLVAMQVAVAAWMPAVLVAIWMVATWLTAAWLMAQHLQYRAAHRFPWGILIGCVLMIGTVVMLWPRSVYRIPTGAMEPTLRGDGSSRSGKATRVADHVTANPLAYVIRKPKRGDLVIFKTRGIAMIDEAMPRDQRFVKRLVAFPGERIAIRNGRLWVNGWAMGEEDGIPPIHYERPGQLGKWMRGDGPITVPDDSYVVFGDASARSWDSRFWGPVPAHNLVGKVTKIVFPLSRMGRPRYRAAEDL